MKKLHNKRFLSMAIAIIMSFSFSAVAFATEPENSTNIEALSTNDDDLIEAMTPLYQGQGRTTITIPFSIKKITVKHIYLMVVRGSNLRITTYYGDTQLSKVYYSRKTDGVEWVPIYHDGTFDNYFGPGDYTMKVEVLFDERYAVCVYGTKYLIE